MFLDVESLEIPDDLVSSMFLLTNEKIIDHHVDSFRFLRDSNLTKFLPISRSIPTYQRDQPDDNSIEFQTSKKQEFFPFE